MSAEPSHFGPVADAGCEGPLNDPAAGSEQAASEDNAGQSQHVNDPGAGCAPAEDAAGDAAGDAAAPKTPPTTLREFEHALRELGFTRSEATAIARGGFKARGTAPPAADLDLSSLQRAMARCDAALR